MGLPSGEKGNWKLGWEPFPGSLFAFWSWVLVASIILTSFIKVLVNFSYQARAMTSVQIYLPQSSIRDPPEFSITSASQHQPLIILSLHNLNPPLQGSTQCFQSHASSFNQLSQLTGFSTRHRHPNSGSRLLYHVTEKLSIEAGLKYGLIWRRLPPLLPNSLDYVLHKVPSF